MLGYCFLAIYFITLGIAFHYLILQLLLWWLFHTTAIFQSTLFPFYNKRLRASKKLKYIHAVMVVLALVLPGVSVAIIATAGSGFTLTRQPTILCSGYNKHYNFALTVLPISLGIAVGTTMLVFILCTVIKVRIVDRWEGTGGQRNQEIFLFGGKYRIT